MNKKTATIVLSALLLLSAAHVSADCSIDVSLNAETDVITVSGSFENVDSVSLAVFDGDFTELSVAEGIYNDETFKLDMDRYKALSEADKKECINFVKQLAAKSEEYEYSYKMSGSPGRYVAVAVNKSGERAYKYFTYLSKADYPKVLAEFNGLSDVGEVLEFAKLYSEVFLDTDNFARVSEPGKLLIAQELYDAKENEEYRSLDDVWSDFAKSSCIQLFYEADSAEEAVEIVSDNSDVLGVDELDSNFAKSNDTYKYEICKAVYDGGAKNYEGWCKAFKDAAKKYADDYDDDGGNNGGSSSSGGSRGGGGGGGSYTASKDLLVTQTANAESLYSDISLEHWAYESVQRLTMRGIVSGDGDSKFRPEDSVTRAEFLKMILSAIDFLDTSAQCSFNDVSTSQWYYSYVATAQTIGIVEGDTDGNFNPQAPVSRQDAVKIMYNAAMFKNYIILENREYTSFSDESTVADYALLPLKSMYCAGIVNGYDDGSFKPAADITRAEAAKMTFSFLSFCN